MSSLFPSSVVDAASLLSQIAENAPSSGFKILSSASPFTPFWSFEVAITLITQSSFTDFAAGVFCKSFDACVVQSDYRVVRLL